MLISDLRKLSIEYTSFIVSLTYDTKIKNYTDNAILKKLFKNDTNVILGIFLIYYQLQKLINISLIEDLEDIEDIPYFITFNDELLLNIYTALDTLNIKNINTLISIYEEYNKTLLEYVLKIKDNDSPQKEILEFITHTNIIIKKASKAYNDILEFLLQLDLDNFDNGKHILQKHNYFNNFDIDICDKKQSFNINNHLLSFKLKKDNIKNELTNSFLMIVAYDLDLITLGAKSANTYKTILTDDKFISKINEKALIGDSLEKENILIVQVKELSNKILNSIKNQKYTINSIFDILKIIQMEFVKYKDYIPITNEKNLQELRDKKMADIAYEVMNQIIKQLDIISKKKERTNEKNYNINTDDDCNKSRELSTERERVGSWSGYPESNKWNS